jgi:trans-aconitate 2-methyltransferase
VVGEWDAQAYDALPHAYLATVVLGAYLDRLAPGDRDGFVRDVAARLGEPVVDSVRLEFSALRVG